MDRPWNSNFDKDNKRPPVDNPTGGTNPNHGRQPQPPMQPQGQGQPAGLVAPSTSISVPFNETAANPAHSAAGMALGKKNPDILGARPMASAVVPNVKPESQHTMDTSSIHVTSAGAGADDSTKSGTNTSPPIAVTNAGPPVTVTGLYKGPGTSMNNRIDGKDESINTPADHTTSDFHPGQGPNESSMKPSLDNNVTNDSQAQSQSSNPGSEKMNSAQAAAFHAVQQFRQFRPSPTPERPRQMMTTGMYRNAVEVAPDIHGNKKIAGAPQEGPGQSPAGTSMEVDKPDKKEHSPTPERPHTVMATNMYGNNIEAFKYGGSTGIGMLRSAPKEGPGQSPAGTNMEVDKPVERDSQPHHQQRVDTQFQPIPGNKFDDGNMNDSVLQHAHMNANVTRSTNGMTGNFMNHGNHNSNTQSAGLKQDPTINSNTVDVQRPFGTLMPPKANQSYGLPATDVAVAAAPSPNFSSPSFPPNPPNNNMDKSQIAGNMNDYNGNNPGASSFLVVQRPPQMQPAPAMPPNRPMQQDPPAFVAIRELKVEDALNYLDQVKLEFGDRPRIYNEFLEIMKNFKAHEIDTPGVIMRVSDLFRGYNNLILGFNTFLPDGFKISIRDLEEGGRYASKKPLPHNIPGVQGVSGPMMNNMQMGEGPQALGHTRSNPNKFGDVINREGWAQYPVGNQTQPVQAQVQSPPPPPPPAQHMLQDPRAPMQEQQQQHHQQKHEHNQQQQQQHQKQNQQQQEQKQEQEQRQQQQQSQNQQGDQVVEFDHAITYVTDIKKRFANEPRTYQQFLEILHTYQKEQRGIREVLEQVSSLFADHPDLLKKFTYFLPEAVQEQAKERLHAAAAEAEARQAAARQRAAEANQFIINDHKNGRGGKQEISFDLTQQQRLASSDTRPPQTSPESKKRPSSPSNMTLQYPMMPETMIYNAGVERQFFDMAKEALRSSSRDGELAWGEFLRIMDLYAQEVLSKNDMFRYMEDLLGKQHADLFEEYKRILAAAGVAGGHSHDDAWHSVPLSEIDFSRCRRCTPSYRALPRDYPVAPFSGRNEEEARLLNDVWISLPDGSEESYTFRHMRKNQHEEVLFRCEDERFEIDMVIDSTTTALNRLEPIADEIAMLQQKEMFSRTAAGCGAKEKSEMKDALETGGMAGKTIKYAFDKNVLNTIHRHAIARIYGDAGHEMLELMEKNPVVAIPVVVKRLKQKDQDFRAARDVLNRRWKELAENNYYKSIDHRSLTWRTIDKRATSTRTLSAEIKDRAAHNGIESEATVIAKRDKAKEEFGSFYEKTMGRYLARKMDLTNLPKPAASMFTPHYSMQYENNSWSQRDAYRILSFALERGTISPGDKERCHRIWTDFLAPFFELSSIWMQSPAVAYAALPHHHTPSIVSNGDDSGNDDDESSAEENEMVGDMMVTEEVMKDCNNADTGSLTGFSLLENQPIPSGASVSTLYGEGTIVDFRGSDKSYIVSLPFGATSYLNYNAVLCTILPVDQFVDLDQSIASDEKPLERDDDKFMLGPQSLYLFFRLHQVLIRRLNIARNLAFSVDNDQSLCTLIEHINADGNASVGQKRYDAYLSLVYGLLDGGYNSTLHSASANAAEGGKYEDRVRCLLGHGAYELATMDKLVSHILKHLQNLATDDTMQGMIQIFKKQIDSGSFRPQLFRQEAAMISEGENTFAFQYCHIPKSDSTIMHVEFLGCITDEDDDDSMISVEASEGPVPKKLKR